MARRVQTLIADLLRKAFADHQAGRLKQAERGYRKILKTEPGHPEALYLFGTLAYQAGDLAAAERRLKAAIDAAPAHAEALHNLARILMDRGKIAGAVPLLERAVAAKPDYASAHLTLGAVYLKLGSAHEAGRVLEQAVSLAPTSAEAWCDLALARDQAGQPTEALKAFDRALDLDPAHARARKNRALLDLRQGRFARGWADYEARREADPGLFDARPFDLPLWQGENLEARGLLVWGEQGLGDQILQASMLPDLEARVARVVFECEPRLQALFDRSLPGVEVVARSTPPRPETHASDLAAQSPGGSLGRWLRPDLASFPQRQSHLTADPDLRRILAAELKSVSAGRPLIGLAWKSARAGLGTYKSTDLAADWGPVLRTPGATFVSLQYGDVSADLSAAHNAHGVEIVAPDRVDPTGDMDSLAALIAELDLVISTSNTAVHLAGGLGVPIWTLVPDGPAALWYWFETGQACPWYSSMRLFRRASGESWDGVFACLAAALGEWMATRN